MGNKPDADRIALEKELARMGRMAQLEADIARKSEHIRHLTEDVEDMQRRLLAETGSGWQMVTASDGYGEWAVWQKMGDS